MAEGAMIAAAVVAAVAALTTAGVTAYSSVQQGKAQKALNDYNAALAQNEAIRAERESRAAAQEKLGQDGRVAARMRALSAASGVVGTEGSPLSVLAFQASETARGASELLRVGNAQATAFRSQSALDRFAGKSAYQAGVMGAWGAGISGVANASRSMAGAFGK